jgi:glycosyltransferase involved in cell wall biosynthesis
VSIVRARRLLVISYHFPPDGAVGGLRWSGISKHLARRGWEIHVITGAARTNAVDVPGVVVHHVPRARTIDDRYKDWVQSRKAEAPKNSNTDAQTAAPTPATSPSPASPSASRPESLTDRIRRSLGYALVFPDDARGWMFRAAGAAQSLMDSISFDAVVSSGPPHSAHMAAALAGVGRHIPHVVDLRDPWSAIPGSLGPNARDAPGWVSALWTLFERVVIFRASRIVANSADFAHLLAREYPARTVSFVPNGIDTERLPARAERFPELTISYLGTMYIGRDLVPVIHAMRAYVDAHPDRSCSIKLRVAGNLRPEYIAKFWSEVDAVGLRHGVALSGPVPGAEALNIINRSHLTLVLAQGQPKQIPAKIYECAAMEVPTLVIGESNGAAVREAKRIGVFACETHDVDGIRRIIEHVAEHPDEPRPPRVPIGYDGIAAAIDSMLGEVVGAPSRGSRSSKPTFLAESN